MLDKDEYEKAQKRAKKRITPAELKRKKLSCGHCLHFEADTNMCNKDWPGVAGKLSARAARTDHNTRTFCGMAGRGFYPNQVEDAVIESETPRRKPGPKPRQKDLPGQG